MLLTRINLEFKRVNTIKYASNGNDVKNGYNSLARVTDTIYITELDEDGRGDIYFMFSDGVAVEIENYCRLSTLTLEQIENHCIKNHLTSHEDFKNYLQIFIDKGYFIRNIFLEVSRRYYPEILGELSKAKSEYLKRQEEQEKAELIELLKEQKLTYNRAVEKFDKLIVDAEQKILNCTELYNADIETPDGQETSLILYLCKKYGVKVPLKTQGWINKGLAKVSFTDGEATYSYWKTSRNSTVFRDYLAELVLAINKAYNSEPAKTEQLEKTITEQQTEVEQVKQIESLNFSEVRGGKTHMEINKALRAKENILEGEQLQLYAILYKAIRSKQPMQDAKKRIEHAKIFHDDITTGEISLNYGKDNTIKAIKSQGQYIFIRDNNKGRACAKLHITETE